jgi:hypothetical protein
VDMMRRICLRGLGVHIETMCCLVFGSGRDGVWQCNIHDHDAKRQVPSIYQEVGKRIYFHQRLIRENDAIQANRLFKACVGLANECWAFS